MAQVYARFDGVASVESASYTLGHGITPSTGEITFGPQPNAPARTGTLILSDGITGLAVPGCVLDSASLVRDGSGFYVAAQIIDRRWKWRFGEIYGRYNVRDAEGEIVAETRKTPAELAKLLLDAMGESGVDTGALPAEPLPEVDWDGDVPAEELAELLEQWGCRIGLDVTGRTRIWKLRQGANAPAGPVERRGADADPPEPPDHIRILFGPTVVGARLELEAVGRDTDGKVVPIDELSYTPSEGWETQTDLLAGVTDEKALVYAKQSVFRWYRVKIPTAGLEVPGVGVIRDVKQILPLLDSWPETYVDPKDLEKKPQPMKVYGTYYLRNGGAPKNSSRDDNWECPIGFRVLGELGVIAFEEQVVKFDEDSAADPASYRYGPATLYADAAFGVNDPETRAYHRYAYLSPTGSRGGTRPAVVSAKSEGGIKVFQKRADPADDAFTWQHAAKASPSHFDGVARKYYDEASARWTAGRGESLTYAGIVAVPVDGLNVQASFSVGPGGAETQLSRSRETLGLGDFYGERRIRERGRRLANREKRRGGLIRGGESQHLAHQGER